MLSQVREVKELLSMLIEKGGSYLTSQIVFD